MRHLRRLPLHHGFNVRDIGGYPIGDTHMSAWNRCYRSDHPGNFDTSDWELMKKANITLFLDLRSTQEQIDNPYDCGAYGIEKIALPFMKEEIQSAEVLDDEARMKFLNSMKLDYVAMLEEAKLPLCTALEKIAQTLDKGEAVLYHCTAGKDRTGILSCILLSICGVSDADILADYEVSATYNELGVNNMLPKEMMAIPSVRALFESTPDMMKPLIAFLKEKTIEAYLDEIGVKQYVITTIKKHLIEE